MALLDLQGLESPQPPAGGVQSRVSLTICGGSAASLTTCN
ncbi:MAG TPA: SapB/AmfS family lanthipeptide [Pseudonocardiaceae bacterium]|jgi:hypothetical protein|nr:SapB/AmfS family lanthipeptide [Pseudonocardiaceae bacterium]